MSFDLKQATIHLVVAGSRAYGLETATSDYDYRGIAIPPLSHYLGVQDRFEQVVDQKDKTIWKSFPDQVRPNSDMQVMELTKFVKLSCRSNPATLEILFTEGDSVLYSHPVMQHLLKIKQSFVTKESRARYLGYALDQMNLAKRHHNWLLNPPDHQPTRAEFGLPEYKILPQDQLGAAQALLEKEVNKFVVEQTHLPESTKIDLKDRFLVALKETWKALQSEPFPVGENRKFSSLQDAQITAVAREAQFSENFLLILGREKQYRSAKQNWDSYQRWLKERNPERAAMEAKVFFDAKNCMHLVRLLKTGKEIFTTGTIKVRREDREELMAIRNGAWSYEQMLEYAEKEKEEINKLALASNLPDYCDKEVVNQAVQAMIMEFHGVNSVN